MKKKLLIIICSIVALIVTVSLIFVITLTKNAKTYNVLFETNGGTIVKSQILKEGEKVIKPNDPTREGYVFIQWIYQGKTYDFSSEVKSDLVLKAEWIEKKEEVEIFTVKFNSDGGTTLPNQIIEKGNKVIKPSDPVKEGYKFIEWQLNGLKYDFEKIIDTNLEIVAKWEKIENKNNKPVNNKKPINNNTSNNTVNNTSNEPNIVNKLSTPTLTENGRGGGPGTWGISYEVTTIEEADGIEIHKSMNGKDYALEKTLTISELTKEKNTIQTMANIGEHNHYKVRAYKSMNGKRIYSSYSRIVEVTGPIFSTPTLTENGRGGGPGTWGISYEVTTIEEADGIEIHKSMNGKDYALEKTLTISELTKEKNTIQTMANIGEHNYYKVRAYKSMNGIRIYSSYSRIVEVTGPKE